MYLGTTTNLVTLWQLRNLLMLYRALVEPYFFKNIFYCILGFYCLFTCSWDGSAFLPFFDGFPCFSGIGFFLLFSSHSPDLYFLYKVLRATCLINLIIISISDQKCPIYNVMYLKFGLSSKLSLVLRGATGFSLFTFLLRSNFLVKVSVKSNIRKWNVTCHWSKITEGLLHLPLDRRHTFLCVENNMGYM